MHVIVDSYIVTALLPDLVGHDRSPAAFVVYLYLASRTQGRLKKVEASLQAIADDTGLSKSAVQSSLRILVRRRLVRTEKASPTARPVHEVLRPWARRQNR